MLWWFERKWPPGGVALLGGVGVGVVLLEEVCHCWGRLKIPLSASDHFLMPARCVTVNYFSSIHVCLHTAIAHHKGLSVSEL